MIGRAPRRGLVLVLVGFAAVDMVAWSFGFLVAAAIAVVKGS